MKIKCKDLSSCVNSEGDTNYVIVLHHLSYFAIT